MNDQAKKKYSRKEKLFQIKNWHRNQDGYKGVVSKRDVKSFPVS
jgi:hypothetical protein